MPTDDFFYLVNKDLIYRANKLKVMYYVMCKLLKHMTGIIF